jgi:hypothetical protein
MTLSKARKEIAALREAALEDLAKTTDPELRKEALECGEDVGRIAAHMRTVMRDAVASVNRKRLAVAREQMEARSQSRPSPLMRPAIDLIKQIVQAAFATDPALGVAYREGKVTSTEDWYSLYDDLVKIGAIQPGNHER